MPTIKDVAKLAEVSVATVSRVMNNNGYVNQNTRQRVEEAIKQLNYRPNDVARSLFKGKSKMIALFVPDIMNPFFPQLARAVEDTANKYGYLFVLCNTDNDNEKEIAYLNALLQKTIDGIILVSNTIQVDQINDINVPIIALDRKINSNIISVTVNNREGASQAVRYLKETGCKRIAHIAGPKDVSSAKQRLEGYLDEVQSEEWFTTDYIRYGNYTVKEAYQATEELLSQHPEIDGIFAANDLMGVSVLKAAKNLGFDIPNQLSVIGYDGMELSDITSPTLTTMAQPIYDIGKRAVEILIEKIENSDKEVESEQYQVQLSVKESTHERREVDE
ncbi:LacI family DNA-binding transcriptional regulator [Paraliobacillus salinarum]|uniref:LacI family DNA-binding transcriptional regulator n=1 Tax=Paraliobacillus salinarum TaxID=1158996 RepID=UPI0015F660B9|nr:LacI family DNA-binding transcriptional regulator [Paraliobacillus salinarum]